MLKEHDRLGYLIAMVLTILLVLLAFGFQAMLYFLGGLYHNNLANFWTWIVLPYLFYWGVFGTYLIFIYIYASIVRAKEEKGVNEWKPNRFAMWIVSQTAFQIFLLFRVKIHASGMGKVPDKHPFVLVHNHLSMFDEFALVYLFRHHPIIFVTKPSNLRIPIAGAWMKKAGYIPIIQDDIADGVAVIKKCTALLENRKTSICIAPEGTRNKDFPETLTLPFHPGSFSMAKDSGCPIVIAAIQNTNAISSRVLLKRTHIYVDIVGIMVKDDYENMALRDIARYAQDRIASRLEQKMARTYHLKKKEED